MLARYQAQIFSKTSSDLTSLSFIIYHKFLAIYKCFDVLDICIKTDVSTAHRHR